MLCVLALTCIHAVWQNAGHHTKWEQGLRHATTIFRFHWALLKINVTLMKIRIFILVCQFCELNLVYRMQTFLLQKCKWTQTEKYTSVISVVQYVYKSWHSGDWGGGGSCQSLQSDHYLFIFSSSETALHKTFRGIMFNLA